MKSVNQISLFNQIRIYDIAKLGGKNASLGEIYNKLNPKGISIPNGFAKIADASRLSRSSNNHDKKLPQEITKPFNKAYKNSLLKTNKI